MGRCSLFVGVVCCLACVVRYSLCNYVWLSCVALIVNGRSLCGVCCLLIIVWCLLLGVRCLLLFSLGGLVVVCRLLFVCLLVCLLCVVCGCSFSFVV